MPPAPEFRKPEDYAVVELKKPGPVGMSMTVTCSGPVDPEAVALRVVGPTVIVRLRGSWKMSSGISKT